jgi:hypothetical protein
VKSEFLIATASSNSIAIAVNSIAVFYRFHSLPSNAYSIPKKAMAEPIHVQPFSYYKIPLELQLVKKFLASGKIE